MFNPHGIGEIIVGYTDGGMDSDYIRNWDVEIDGEWVDLSSAFKDHRVITDNYSDRFFLPQTDEDRVRGYTLY